MQTGTAQALRKFVTDKQNMFDDDRQAVLSFLSNDQGSEYTPSSLATVALLQLAKLADCTASFTD